jgi:predicted  nucleic acid-binding Zn-ribbon protein
MNFIPEHERLFDEICNKLNELSLRTEKGPDMEATKQQTLEKMQGQIRRFQNDLEGAHEELRDKIRNLETVQYSQNDLNQQLKTLGEQLSQERTINTKLNTDLAKSLELSLQLQLEIQALKARSQQVQTEEKKYSQSLVESVKALQNEVELVKALKEEVEIELDKAMTTFHQQQDQWKVEKSALQETWTKEKEALIEENKFLNDEIQKLSDAFEELEDTAQKQNEVLKSIMETAESKIVEMKMAFDRKAMECQDYYAHLQQSLTQASLLKQENANLKEHIEKINQYIQSQNDAR